MSTQGESGLTNNGQGSFVQDEARQLAAENEARIKEELAVKPHKQPIFSETGHVTFESISARREFFLGKSVSRIEHELQKHGYKTKRRGSVHATSKARVIIVTNQSKERNISQMLVSPGSKRHGDVPYVKISTTDHGRIKIIASTPEEYKTDSREKAKLLFRRKRRK